MTPESKMDMNFTAELSRLMKFTGATASAIRMYSAYSGGSPSTYLHRPADPKRESVELMFLSDALHHFTALGRTLETADPAEIVRVCDELLSNYAHYDVERPEFGDRQAKPVFDAWKQFVPLADARAALSAIRAKAASNVTTA